MELTDLTNEETFKAFCEKNFPGKIFRWTSQWCFVQAGNHLSNHLHYEFQNGKVELHIEGPNWRGLRNYLNSKRPIPHDFTS